MRKTPKEYMQERRNLLKKNGLCQECGLCAPYPDRTLCLECLISRRKWAKGHPKRRIPIRGRNAAHVERMIALAFPGSRPYVPSAAAQRFFNDSLDWMDAGNQAIFQRKQESA